jgi:hypothetical protein
VINRAQQVMSDPSKINEMMANPEMKSLAEKMSGMNADKQ